MTTDMSLRDRARGAVRDEVAKHAWTLFVAQGFEATTVDQIAEAAGMSRRTFFRYFEGKDELVLAQLVESGQPIADELRARPASESAWPALRAAFTLIVDLQEEHANKSRPLLLMLRDESALRTTLEARRRLWLELLAPLTAERLPARSDTGPDVRAAAVTGSAMACLEAAQAAWAEHPGSSLARLLDAGMEAVSPLT
ncbi:MAG: TetR family transcriptional regulator [Aeromicrobium sp.]